MSLLLLAPHRSLAPSLRACLQASTATLVTCQRMAQCKPAFAELLLPHAFDDLAVQTDSGSLGLELGGLISQQLLPHLHRHPKAARLLLACLNHLRSQYLDAKVAGGAGSKAKGGLGTAAAAEYELWRKVSGWGCRRYGRWECDLPAHMLRAAACNAAAPRMPPGCLTCLPSLPSHPMHPLPACLPKPKTFCTCSGWTLGI